MLPEATISELSTAALEAAIYGGQVEEDGSVTPTPEDQPDTIAPDAAIPDEQEAMAVEATVPAFAASEQPQEMPAPSEAAPESLSGWTQEELRAAEIRNRNPDIRLDTALQMARRELGIEEQSQQLPTEQEPEKAAPPTTAEQIALIAGQLNAAGADEGLYNAEIATLSQEYARLSGVLAVEQSQESQRQAVEQDQLQVARQGSVDRLRARHPESSDPNTPIGRQMNAVLERLLAQDNPMLYETDAPEKVFQLAIGELSEADRPESIYTRSQPTAPAPAQPISALQQTAAIPPKPNLPTSFQAPVMTVEPVSGGNRSATVTPANVAPAQVGEMIRSLDLSTLEAAIYGTGEPEFFVR